jgi:hypothetical protein
MTRLSRVLAFCAGVSMFVAGVLLLEGSRFWLPMVGAALALAIGPLAAWKRSG